jgi:hypothetical protein
MLADMKTESKGDEDYGYNSMEITAITGTVANAGDSWTFKARGSNEVYDLVPTPALRKLVAEGKSPLTIAGKVSGEGRLKIEITDAKVPAN